MQSITSKQCAKYAYHLNKSTEDADPELTPKRVNVHLWYHSTFRSSLKPSRLNLPRFLKHTNSISDIKYELLPSHHINYLLSALSKTNNSKTVRLKLCEDKIRTLRQTLPKIRPIESLDFFYVSKTEQSSLKPFTLTLKRLIKLRIQKLSAFPLNMFTNKDLVQFLHVLSKFQTLTDISLRIGINDQSCRRSPIAIVNAITNLMNVSHISLVFYDWLFTGLQLSSLTESFQRVSDRLTLLSLSFTVIEADDISITEFWENIIQLNKLQRLNLLMEFSYEGGFDVKFETILSSIASLSKLQDLLYLDLSIGLYGVSTNEGVLNSVKNQLSFLGRLQKCYIKFSDILLNDLLIFSDLLHYTRDFTHHVVDSRLIISTQPDESAIFIEVTSEASHVDKARTNLRIRIDHERKCDEDELKIVRQIINNAPEAIEGIYLDITDSFEKPISSLLRLFDSIPHPDHLRTISIYILDIDHIMSDDFFSSLNAFISRFKYLTTLKFSAYNLKNLYGHSPSPPPAKYTYLEGFKEVLLNFTKLREICISIHKYPQIADQQVQVIGDVISMLDSLHIVIVNLSTCSEVTEKAAVGLARKIEKCSQVERANLIFKSCMKISENGHGMIKEMLNRVNRRKTK